VFNCHSRERGNPTCSALALDERSWMPAFAGMTKKETLAQTACGRYGVQIASTRFGADHRNQVETMTAVRCIPKSPFERPNRKAPATAPTRPSAILDHAALPPFP